MLQILLPVLIIVLMAMLALALKQILTGKSALKGGACVRYGSEDKGISRCKCGDSESCNLN